MRSFCVLILAVGAVSSSASPTLPVAAPAAPDSFQSDWLSRIAGPGAMACGTNLHGDEAGGRDCASSAITGTDPFWISYEEASLGAGGWSGFARNAKGEMWMVAQDSGSELRNVERPKVVTVVTCKRLFVDGQKVQCTGI